MYWALHGQTSPYLNRRMYPKETVPAHLRTRGSRDAH